MIGELRGLGGLLQRLEGTLLNGNCAFVLNEYDRSHPDEYSS